MKNLKRFFTGVIAAVAMPFVFAACENGNETNDPNNPNNNPNTPNVLGNAPATAADFQNHLRNCKKITYYYLWEIL